MTVLRTTRFRAVRNRNNWPRFWSSGHDGAEDPVWVCHRKLQRVFDIPDSAETLWVSVSRQQRNGWDAAVLTSAGNVRITLNSGADVVSSLAMSAISALQEMGVRSGDTFWVRLHYSTS